LVSLSPVGPATFTVTGAANATYSITLTTTIVLSATGGTLSEFPVAGSPNPTGLLSAAEDSRLWPWEEPSTWLRTNLMVITPAPSA
jgi:hypothetical protein